MVEQLVPVVGIGVVMLIAFFVMRAAFGIHVRIHGYSYTQSMSDGNNAAFVRFAGIFLGATLGFWGVIAPTELGIVHDIIKIVTSLSLVIIFMVIAGYVNDKVILHQVNNLGEIFDRQNISVALIESGSFIATGLIFSASQSGASFAFSSIGWFACGQVLLVVSVFLFAFMHKGINEMNKQALNNNTGYACALTGFIISVGLVVSVVVNNVEKPAMAVMSLFIWLVVTFVLQFVMNRFIVRGTTLNTIILSGRSEGNPCLGAGALQGIMFLVSALVITVLN